jgi:hypothetical protein
LADPQRTRRNELASAQGSAALTTGRRTSYPATKNRIRSPRACCRLFCRYARRPASVILTRATSIFWAPALRGARARQTGPHQVGKHLDRETVREHDRFGAAAWPSACEHFQCPALLPTKLPFPSAGQCARRRARKISYCAGGAFQAVNGRPWIATGRALIEALSLPRLPLACLWPGTPIRRTAGHRRCLWSCGRAGVGLIAIQRLGGVQTWR